MQPKPIYTLRAEHQGKRIRWIGAVRGIIRTWDVYVARDMSFWGYCPDSVFNRYNKFQRSGVNSSFWANVEPLLDEARNPDPSVSPGCYAA